MPNDFQKTIITSYFQSYGLWDIIEKATNSISDKEYWNLVQELYLSLTNNLTITRYYD